MATTQQVGTVAGSAPAPDPEVPERARTRTFSPRYKLDILTQYESLNKQGKQGEGGGLAATRRITENARRTSRSVTMPVAACAARSWSVVGLTTALIARPPATVAVAVHLHAEIDRAAAEPVGAQDAEDGGHVVRRNLGVEVVVGHTLDAGNLAGSGAEELGEGQLQELGGDLPVRGRGLLDEHEAGDGAAGTHSLGHQLELGRPPALGQPHLEPDARVLAGQQRRRPGVERLEQPGPRLRRDRRTAVPGRPAWPRLGSPHLTAASARRPTAA